jgi:signal transduction histidine kinase/CheY-like chemotaxis protein
MNVEFLILYALILSITLNIMYFIRKHINSNEAKIFSKILFSNLLGLMLELMCIYMSNKFSPTSLPAIIFTRAYLIYLITYLLFMTLYNYVLCYTTEKQKKLEHYKKLRNISYTIYAVCVVVCMALPLQTEKGYAIGPAVNFVYLCSTICINVWFIPMIKNRKIIEHKKFVPLYIFILLIIIVAIIQRIYPQATLITIVEFLIVFIMYHTIENPDMKMLDEVHKAKVISDNANEEKTLFLYNMTNEIRGITKDIDKETDNILDETDNKKIDVEEINNSARNIKGSTAKFTTMTNEILDISSIDSASVRIYNEKYNIKRLLKELVGIYKPKAQNKNLDFRVSIASDIPEYLYGDGINLKKVLTIILDNSIKYTNNGYIEFNINTIIKGDIARLIISVEDSGIGMKAEDINKIFTKKQEREDNHNLNNNLYNAKRLITLMNGTIVPSSSYGSGTTIKIILDQKYDTIDTDINKYDNIYDKKKVLLIDDSPSSEKLFNKILSGTNIELTSVKLGKEGLEKIRSKEKYDLILLDEELEPQNGHIIMRKLLEIRNFNIKVILLTKDNKYDYDDSYLQEGFTDYIIKSSDKEEMLNKINKYLK